MPRWVRPLFAVAALYDLVLGVGMLLFFRRLYAALEIPLPNHDAYLQFGAAVVVVFGVGFVMVARDPLANRGIIVLGVLFKLAYAVVVLGHALLGSMPALWTVFAWADLAFAAGFAASLAALRPVRAPAAGP